jgi:hypothetical protein
LIPMAPPINMSFRFELSNTGPRSLCCDVFSRNGSGCVSAGSGEF